MLWGLFSGDAFGFVKGFLVDIVWLLVQFIALSAVIVVAGTKLAHFGDIIGEWTGMGRTLVGVVLLAAATSMPEFAVDCSSAHIGLLDQAVGDLLGSSLMNLMILGLLDLIFRPRGKMLNRLGAEHAFSATMSLILTVIVLLCLLLEVPLLFGLRASVGSVVLMVAYLLMMRLIYFDEQEAIKRAAVEEQTTFVEPELSLRRAISGYLICTAAIFIAAPFLAKTAGFIADETGLGGTFIGTTLLALCTSLPEAVTTWAAVRMGAYDMAVGNIFGSNTFNMAIIPAVDLFYDGSLFAAVSPIHAVTATMVLLVTGVAMLGLLYRVEKKYWLIEPDSALLVLLVLGALGIVYMLGEGAPVP